MEPTQKRSPRQEAAPASFEFLPVFTPPRLALFQGRGEAVDVDRHVASKVVEYDEQGRRARPSAGRARRTDPPTHTNTQRAGARAPQRVHMGGPTRTGSTFTPQTTCVCGADRSVEGAGIIERGGSQEIADAEEPTQRAKMLRNGT